MSTCLVLFKPREIFFIHIGKILRTLHHKVDEVSAAPEARRDQKVCQNPEEPAQMDVLIFLVLLLIHYGFLHRAKLDSLMEQSCLTQNFLVTYYICMLLQF